MNKKNWKFTQTQWIILGILASMTIFMIAIDIYYLFGKEYISKIPSPVNTISTTSDIKSTMTESLTNELRLTNPAPTNLSQTELPQVSISPTITTSPVATSFLSNTSTPTSTPPPKFFTNEWDENTYNWKWFSTIGNDNLWDVYNEAGVLVFSLLGKDTNGYFIYTSWDYNKVSITTQFEVRSNTKSSMVVLCNYSEDVGWYEFIVGTDGLWEIRLHDTRGKSGYLSLVSGGSLAIRTGEAINEFTATCDQNHLRLSINNTEVVDFTDEIMKYEGGKIGLGVFSYSQIPVLIESAWVKIDQP